MEKRLILSLALSFAVLYAWAALGPQKPAPVGLSEDSQITDNKEFTDISSKFEETGAKESFEEAQSDIRETAADILAKAENEEIPENETILENEKLAVTVTNKGGNIKSVLIKEYGVILPAENLASLPSYNDQNFSIVSSTEGSIDFRLSIDGQGEIVKSYSLNADDYIIQASIKRPKMSNLEDVSFQGFTLNIPIQEKTGAFGGDRAQTFYEYVIHSANKTVRKNNAYKFSEKNRKMESTAIDWVGFRDRYFCLIVKPEFETFAYSIEDKKENVLDVKYTAKNSSEWTSTIYVGPESTEILKKYDLGFEQIKRYYRWGLFDGIAKVLQGLMHFVHKLIPNWGVSIILISLLVYGCTYPMTIKSMSSMRKMQALQPKMTQIKEKHANNPQKMNQEMMELYKKEKVNPLGGCLPMFLQLPVFIGLYQVLWRSVEFKGASFLWIKDLAEPDRLIVLKSSLPLIGTDINILPLFMMVIMFVQQKLSAKNMVISDPMQAQQQKMMQTIFPIFLGVIFYKFSSGLTLYFTMFYILSAFTQWKIGKKPQVV